MNPLTSSTFSKPDCLMINGQHILNVSMSTGSYGMPVVEITIGGEGASSVMAQMHGTSAPLPPSDPFAPKDSSLDEIRRLTEEKETLRTERDISVEQVEAWREMVSDYEGEISTLKEENEALVKKLKKSIIYSFDPGDSNFATGGVISQSTLPEYAARDLVTQNKIYDSIVASGVVGKWLT